MPPDHAGFSVQDMTNGANILPPRYSDDAIASTFSTRHDGQMLYVPAWASWLHWNGAKWAKDDVLAVSRRHAHKGCRRNTRWIVPSLDTLSNPDHAG